MKRRNRLNYSTNCFPVNQYQTSKKIQTEDVKEGEEHNQYSNDRFCADEHDLNIGQNQEGKFQIDEDKPLRVKPKEKVQDDTNKEETVEEIITRKLQTNPIRLIKQGKENQYGNFRSYYDHRYEKKWSDPRLKVLDKNWFLNKEVLDIGCNDGSLTLQIAIKYFPFKIIGIDIDFNLINKAVGNYTLLETQQAKCKNNSNQSEDDQGSQNQSDNYKKIKDKLSKLPKSFLIDRSKQNEKLEEMFLKQNADSILQDQEINHLQVDIEEPLNPTIGQANNQNISKIEKNQVENLSQQALPEKEEINLSNQKDEQIFLNSNKDQGKQEITEVQIHSIQENNKQITDQNQYLSDQLNQTLNEQKNEEAQSDNQNQEKDSQKLSQQVDQENILNNQDENNSVQSFPQQVVIKKRFPQNTKFRLENYVESTELTEKYDTICCFSTTKWIHLNFGDQGIKRLFDKVYRSLRVNGIFILEPQEWRSYKKKQSFSEEFRQILKSIKLHPGEFKQHLLENYKFILEKEIIPELNSNKVPAFFKRIVYVFRKIE